MPFPVQMRFVRRTEDRLGVLLLRSYANAMCQENGGDLIIAETGADRAGCEHLLNEATLGVPGC